MPRVAVYLRQRWTHRSAGELYLLTTGAGSALIAAALLLLDPLKTTSPALRVLYDIASRASWGWGWLTVAVLCLAVAAWPTEIRFIVAISLVVFLQVTWVAGLFAPTLGDGASNVLASILLLQLIVTLLVGVLNARRPLLPPRRRPPA